VCLEIIDLQNAISPRRTKYFVFNAVGNTAYEDEFSLIPVLK
jgi:hypothetical protein